MRTQVDVQTITHSADYSAVQFGTDDHFSVWKEITLWLVDHGVTFTYYGSDTPFTVREDNGKWTRVEDQQYIVASEGVYTPHLVRVCDKKALRDFQFHKDASRLQKDKPKPYTSLDEKMAWLKPGSGDEYDVEDSDLFVDGFSTGWSAQGPDPDAPAVSDPTLFEAAVAQQDDADIQLANPTLPGNVTKEGKDYVLKLEDVSKAGGGCGGDCGCTSKATEQDDKVQVVKPATPSNVVKNEDGTYSQKGEER